MLTRSRSRGRSESDPASDPPKWLDESSLARSPLARTRRHSEGRMGLGGLKSGVEEKRAEKSRPHPFMKQITNVSETLNATGEKMQRILGILLEFILICLVKLVLQARMTFWPNSGPYERAAARIDVLSFLWVGFWSLVVTLFFIPPDPEMNVVKRVAKFAVGTFQTTGLLFVLFFMLYFYKKSY